MDTEFEAKFYPVKKDVYRKKLQEIGAKLTTPERKMRRALVDRRLFPQIKCDYIRVRDEGGLVRLSAKTHALEVGKLSDQKEVDGQVSSYDKTIKIIELMGFKFDKYQETLREEWKFNETEITIDTWPGLFPYSEIEADSEMGVRDLVRKLKLDWDKRIITSVTEVYMRVYSLSLGEVLKRLENCTFENNPFKGLTKKWNGD